MPVEPLLERESELVALVEAVEAARAGAGSFVLVAGEAGIGKTSLVRALRARLGGGAAFAVGACEALSVPVPLGPVLELFAATPAAGTARRTGPIGSRWRGRCWMRCGRPRRVSR